MATSRELLEYIMGAVAAMIDAPDEALDSVKDGLKRVDDELDEGLEYLGIDRRA